MKRLLGIATACCALVAGAKLQAAPPYGANYGCSSGYSRSNVYGAYPGYGAYSGYGNYGSNSGFNQNWNSSQWNGSTYGRQSAVYDPVHGDYHTIQSWPMRQSFSRSGGGFGQWNGHNHHGGATYGW